jgi:cell division cycle protein 37
VELLNPESSSAEVMTPSSGAEADIEDGEKEDIKPTPAAKKFAEIAFGDYRTSLQFVSENRSILTKRDSDALLFEAFNNQLDGKEKLAKQCVHQSLLLQYCQQLGKDGVGLCFKRMIAKDHKAYKLFIDDVNSTYEKLKQSAAKIRKDREESANAQDVEQIQLYATDPNTKLTIRVPPPIPSDLGAVSDQQLVTEEHIAARRLFESFPPTFQRALESGELDEVNKALGKMRVEEAEEVVQKLGEGGILNLEEGVIDATTEEGQKVVAEIERTGQVPQTALGHSEHPPGD